MKVKYILEGLDCANCAAKIEDEVSKIEGINSASVSFMTTKMVLEVIDENSELILEKVQKTVKKLEPDVQLKRI